MAHTLLVRDGDHLRAASAQEVPDRAAALMAQRFRAGALVLGSPDRTRQYLRHQIGTLTVRSLRVVLLDLCVASSYVQRCSDLAENAGPAGVFATHKFKLRART
jgi:hypothetical protein